MAHGLLSNFLTAVEAITRNKLRSTLTSLGIVFGVASVISMLAIGRGAQQEILDRMRLLGTNNIIITPIVEQEEGKAEGNESEKTREKKKFSPGLTLADARGIGTVIPAVESVSPEVILETTAIREGLKRTTKLVGVDTTFFRHTDFELAAGSFFSPQQHERSLPVAVIGHAIKTKFFTREDPIGRQIKCGKLWLTVVGVLKERNISKQNIQHLGLRDYNYDIYSPVNTVLLRYKNRSLVTRRDIQNAAREGNNNSSDEEETKKAVNYHQIDRLVVRVQNSAQIRPVADVVSRMLQRRHNGVVDFSVTIPEELLKQEQRTKEIFNIVLGAIASISLVVGGIGIMNIMLASVLERTKEIGIRRSVGATRKDIILQFLSEATTISVSGGIVGILLGLGISTVIERTAGILTIVSLSSVVISFAISISIGIAFGFFPARTAAYQDVIQSLRYE
ncbi:MAG: FtsX-like permease family protein [Bacteroidetes bacterium]|nr:MAG: FtsX-like permease family protein [Bacteroidota bacterium]